MTFDARCSALYDDYCALVKGDFGMEIGRVTNGSIRHLDSRIVIKSGVEIKDWIMGACELREEVREVVFHEVFHAIQKYAYHSVYSVANAIQFVDSVIFNIVCHNIQRGHVWRYHEDFLRDMDHIDDRLPDLLVSELYRANDVYREIGKGLSCLDLIEGQAFVASRFYCKKGMGNLMDVPAVYLNAWRFYLAHGGSDELLFLVIMSASLRYGGVEAFAGSGSSSGLQPHPVTIFIALVESIADIENAIEHGSSVQPSESMAYFRVGKNSSERYKLRELTLRPFWKLFKLLRDRHVLSSNETPESNSEYWYRWTADVFDGVSDSAREEDEVKVHGRIFESIAIGAWDSASDNMDYLWKCRAVATAVESMFCAVADRVDLNKTYEVVTDIPLEVGKMLKELYPNHGDEVFICRYIQSENNLIDLRSLYDIFAIQTGKLSIRPSHLNDKVISIDEYLGNRCIPEFIIGMQQKYKSMTIGSDQLPPYVQKPYCCPIHFDGHDQISDYDSCEHRQSLRMMIESLCGRKPSKLFIEE